MNRQQAQAGAGRARRGRLAVLDILYVLHVAAIAGVGVGLPVMCGMASPRARLVHYRLVLLLALILPLAPVTASPVTPVSPNWLRAVIQAEQGAPGVGPQGDHAQARSANVEAAASAMRSVGQAMATVIALGFAARLVWVAVGLRSLRRLRRAADRLEPRPSPVRDAVVLASADADIKMFREVPHRDDVRCLDPVSSGTTQIKVTPSAA